MGDYNQELQSLSDQVADLHNRLDDLFARHFGMMADMLKLWQEHNAELAKILADIKQ